jgi:PRTRC genetic system protein F
MLTRYQPNRRPRRSAADAAINRAAARISSPLVLPKLGSNPHYFEFTNKRRVAAMAEQFIDVGLMTPDNYDGRRTVADNMEACLTKYVREIRPRPLDSKLVLNARDEFEADYGRYEEKYGVAFDGAFNAFTLHSAPYDGMEVQDIGPMLDALESWGLGTKVMTILDLGLDGSCRGITPGSAVDWASQAYWRGENDEKWVLEEWLDEYKDDVASKKTLQQVMDENNLNIMRRADIAKAIPEKFWQQTHRKTNDKSCVYVPFPKLPDKLNKPWPMPASAKSIARAKQTWPEILAVCNRIVAMLRGSKKQFFADCDSECLENYCSFMGVPFILLYHERNDEHNIVAQIADDLYNDYQQASEYDLALNAAFIWHDTDSLKRALKQLTNYLTLTQACEDLIRLLAEPKK